MMQGAATTQHLRSTLRTSQLIVCRSSATRLAPRRAYSVIRASGRMDDDFTAQCVPYLVHILRMFKIRNYFLFFSSENNQNGTGSMDSDEKRPTIAETISKESDIVFLLRLISISFAGEIKAPPRCFKLSPI